MFTLHDAQDLVEHAICEPADEHNGDVVVIDTLMRKLSDELCETELYQLAEMLNIGLVTRRRHPLTAIRTWVIHQRVGRD